MIIPTHFQKKNGNDDRKAVEKIQQAPSFAASDSGSNIVGSADSEALVSPNEPITGKELSTQKASDNNDAKPFVKENPGRKKNTVAKKQPAIDQVLDSPKEKIESEVPQIVDKANELSLKVAFVQAEPVNGYPDLYAYFDRELKYPQEALKDSLQGVVTVIFTVSLQGEPEGIRIENSLCEPFDREVFRVLGNMPLWAPATYNGKPVESKVSLTLTFHYKKVNAKD